MSNRTKRTADELLEGAETSNVPSVAVNTLPLVSTQGFDKKFWVVMRSNYSCQGPYESKERAQQEAALLLAKEPAWDKNYVMELVGTVLKPLPQMHWHAPKEE